IMAPKDSKGMKIEVAGKGLKRLQKGTKGASSSKEAKYAPENWIDEGFLALEFPAIQDKLHEL
ncbi:hypothetical protein HAX54_018198, partial [Datura stramonium]|nr:hypothetical protein [Datura stramonium]